MNHSHAEVARLEQKLDHMVALLAASDQATSTKRPRMRAPEARLGSESLERIDGDGHDDGATPSIRDALISLELYRTKMFGLFPFVAMAPHMTADQLKEEKPFLSMAITMVVCQTAPRREIAKAIGEHIANDVILKGGQSLDILQGLLIYVNWHYAHVQSSAQLVNLIHLTIAQVINLGLDRAARAFPSYLKELDIEGTRPAPPTLEERRAYLGCYYLTSLLSACTRDMEPMRYTYFTQECCNIIRDGAEYDSDKYLVQLVGVAQLAEKIHRGFSWEGLDPVSSVPVGLAVKWQEAELQQLKASLSSDTGHRDILLLHYHTLEIILYKIALADGQSDIQFGDHPMTQLDLLVRCLESTRSFFSCIFSLESRLFPIFPYTFWCQVGHAIIVLSRLSLYDSEKGHWDRDYVRNTIDYNDTVDQLAGKLDEARLLIEEQATPSDRVQLPEIFTLIPIRVRMLKEAYQRRQEALANPRRQSAPAAVDQGELLPFVWGDLLLFSDMPDLFGGFG
ncbi:fungal specific transcription factor domain-containing protein [Aspergillus alliaceus]|uniref:fungal specific transcription factor domain-containing protein n=1 Tax=Petromyces alliaceus TaxID=209559 RepID=UPI0012A6888B|nr:uncharacterized protein BDW43DRAFT_313161 [Aspergillus alliaceus]KAB8231349.1 hypothetical protein BDW43DRAFT_313161 [Aspergillus alliaceus]